ncbi:MAG: hypothetical protein PHQ40_05915 [Anaerolineaceae bacterium]|nr:hypothetical protein [Anaerolineaceae bacterium]
MNAVATSATRGAENQAEFIQRLHTEAGLDGLLVDYLARNGHTQALGGIIRIPAPAPI